MTAAETATGAVQPPVKGVVAAAPLPVLEISTARTVSVCSQAKLGIWLCDVQFYREPHNQVTVWGPLLRRTGHDAR